ncbi:MAG: Rrf2 family transcriptional regulator [Actinomycetota bacterium]|nr:Rrf2 family transcriptional regulator [Actinomycetota bacterium]
MRLEITRRTDLATRALLVLADDGGRLKASQLAERVGASAGFLSQAMTPLVAEGWVRSEPGPTGGYVLAVDLSDVTVLDVIEAIEGPTDTAQCVLEDRPCAGGGLCALHHPWSRARSQLLDELGSTSLSGLSPTGHRRSGRAR